MPRGKPRSSSEKPKPAAPAKKKGAEAERVEVAGREVAISNPDKVLFPEAGYTKLDLVRYYLAVADGALRGAGGRPNVLVRYPNGIGGGVLLSEARAGLAAAVDRSRVAPLSVRAEAPRKSCRATRRRWPGWPTSPASSCIRTPCAPTTWIIPTSCGSISIRCRASSGSRSARSRGSSRAALRTSRAHRLAQDLGLARHARDRADRAALGLRPGAPRGAGAGARGRAARARDRHQQVVEGGAARGVRRLQPERQGPHRRVGLLGAAQARRPRLGADRLGRAGRLRSGGLHPGDDAGAVREASAIGTRASTIVAGSLDALLELSARQEREGQGDAPWPPHYEKQQGEPTRVQPSQGPRREAPADRDRPRADARRTRWPGLERWKARHPEAAAHLEPADVLVDSMRGRFTTWTRIRVNLQHVPAELRPAQEPLDPDEKTFASS